MKAENKTQFIETWVDEMRLVIGFFPLDDDLKEFCVCRDKIIEMIKRKGEYLEKKGVFNDC